MLRSKGASAMQPTVRSGLIRARYQRGWSQQQLAHQIGTTPLSVSRWERGLTQPGPYFHGRLVALFGLSASELGLLPSVPRQGEEERALQAAPERQACYDDALPPPSSSLFGRFAELARLKQCLLRSPGLSLSGLPGVGKTSLAVALAHDADVREHFADGILWARLGPRPQLQEVLRHWGRLLDINACESSTPGDMQEWTYLLREAIGCRRFLIVLDDVWNLDDVRSCQIGGAACSYLLTTRSPLQACLVGHACFGVEPLDEETSLQLLSALAPQAAALSPSSLLALVRQVAGLPLSLALIVHYLRQHAYGGQPRRLMAALCELQQGHRHLSVSRLPFLQEAPPRCGTPMISVEGAITASVQRLSKEGRAALCALSIFGARPASFTQEAALAVCQQPVTVLAELYDAGLLESVEEGHYSLHQSIIDYVRSGDRPAREL